MRIKFAPARAWAAAAWVAGTLAAFAAGPAGANTFYASPTGDDDNRGTMEKPWRTLQRAKRALQPGDTLLIADGDYPGGVHHATDGEPGKPITYKAINPGRVIIHGEQSDDRDAFVIIESNWVVVDGLVLQNAERDGIWVQSSCNVIVRNCIARNNGVTGIFTSYSDDVLIENNECYNSGEQHGIYISNSGDRPVVRYNFCHDNNRCGIQLNGDGKQVKEKLGTRGDGHIDRATIDSNICCNNGADAGAAINVLSVRDSVISNNLVFGNKSGGISLYNDNRKTATEWGSKNNLIAFNTVYFRKGEGRWCISFTNGSTDNVVENNILSGGLKGGYQFDDTSSFTGDYNLIYSPRCPFAAVYNDEGGKGLTSTDYCNMTGNDAHSIFSQDPKFVDPTSPNPNFHLKSDSPAAHAGATMKQIAADADGNTLPDTWAPDMGCYGGASSANSNSKSSSSGSANTSDNSSSGGDAGGGGGVGSGGF